ncbi:MAG: hypothetical protein KF884_11270 [Fimbriimonadaceae bacterium]|nr:hypothetical protein [Fimbriimonadaceae bacterium]QYK58124.1 MAG: hypothetical protein KF884_11270 [Fimbriimonadaceae bacterium]
MLFALSLVLTAKQDLVSFRHEGASVSKVVRALGEATGEKWAAEGPLRDEFLFVSVADKPIEAVRQKIAEVLVGQWVKTEDGWRLEPDRFKRAALETARREVARKNVDEFVSKTKKTEPLTSQRAEAIVRDALKQLERADEERAWNKLEEIDSHDPSASLAAGLLSLVAADCLNLPEYSRVVYSSHPTRLQRPLPTGSSAWIDRYLKESRALAGVLEKLQVPERLESMEFGKYSELLTAEMPHHKPGSVVQATVTRDSDTLSIDVELGGYWIGYEGISLVDESWSQTQKNLAGLETPFKPGPGTAEAAKASAAIRDAGRPAEEQEAAARFTLNRLKKLDERDLHADFTTEALTQISEALKLDTVVRLSDTWLQLGSILARSRVPTLSRVFTVFSQRAPLKVSDGWLMSEPEIGTDWPPLERRGLQAFARRVESQGLGFDALADLAAYCDTDINFFVNWHWVVECMPGGPTRFSGQEDFPALRLYGALDENSRKLAKSGGAEIVYGTAPPRLKAAFDRLLWYVHPVVDHKDAERQGEAMEEDSDGAGVSLVTEPTTLLPNGIPPNTPITLKLSDEKRWSVMVKGQARTIVTSGSLEGMALLLASQSVNHPDSFAQARIGNLASQVLTVEARFTEELFWGSKAVLKPWVTHENTLPAEKMPADFKAAFDAASSQVRKEAKSAPVRRERPIP